MNKPRFLELVRDPDKLEFFDLEKLEEVVANFPYFQAAHLLIAKLAKAEASMFAAEKLNMAAVCTLDRKKLKKWMQTKPRTLTVFVNHSADSESSIVNQTNTDDNQSTTAIIDTKPILNEDKEQTVVQVDTAQPSLQEEIKEQTVEEEIKEQSSLQQEIKEQTGEEVVSEQSSLQEEIKEQTVAEVVTEQPSLQEEIKEQAVTEVDTEQSSLQEEIKEQTVAEVVTEQSGLQEEFKEHTAVEEVFLKEKVNEEDINTALTTDTLVKLPIVVGDLKQDEIKVHDIETATKQEAHSTTNQDFYAELENNLKLLRQNKEEATRSQEQKHEADTEISYAPIATPSVEEGVVENQYIENANTNLEDSRLEEILRKDIDERNKFSEKDLLIEYFNYLSQRRVARLNDKRSVNNLIDKFITNEPTIPKLKPNAVKVPLIDLSEKSTKPVTKIVSENFAKILASQGKLDKAIEMYEALGLKNPEKKAYFANLILELKNKNTNQ